MILIQTAHANEAIVDGWTSVGQISSSDEIDDEIASPSFAYNEGTCVRFIRDGLLFYTGIFSQTTCVNVGHDSDTMRRFPLPMNDDFHTAHHWSLIQCWMHTTRPGWMINLCSAHLLRRDVSVPMRHMIEPLLSYIHKSHRKSCRQILADVKRWEEQEISYEDLGKLVSRFANKQAPTMTPSGALVVAAIHLLLGAIDPENNADFLAIEDYVVGAYGLKAQGSRNEAHAKIRSICADAMRKHINFHELVKAIVR